LTSTLTTKAESAVDTSKWTQKQALTVCRLIEAIAPAAGCHVALTGGLLYKEGERKDLDIVLYRIRQAETIDWDGLQTALRNVGFEFREVPAEYENAPAWVRKATFQGKPVDFFFPEEASICVKLIDPETWLEERLGD
jgi:hypothetical protein